MGAAGRVDGSGGSAATGADARAIQDVVERFLLHVGDHDFDKIAADLTSRALVLITREANGQWSNTYLTGDEWLTGLKRNPNRFREPLKNVSVTVDSDQLAYVRADFEIVRDGRAQAHGVDQFTLMREPSGWKIAVVAFTSIPR
jgi:ketosteroid isomerase-like protein